MSTRDIVVDILESGVKELDFDLDKFIDTVVDKFFKLAKLGFPYNLFKGLFKRKLFNTIMTYYKQLKKESNK